MAEPDSLTPVARAEAESRKDKAPAPADAAPEAGELPLAGADAGGESDPDIGRGAD